MSAWSPRGGDGLLAGAASAPSHIVPSSERRTLVTLHNNSFCKYLSCKPSRWLGRQDVGIADWRWYTAVSHRASSIHRRSTLEENSSRRVDAPVRIRRKLIVPVAIKKKAGVGAWQPLSSPESWVFVSPIVWVGNLQILFISHTTMFP